MKRSLGFFLVLFLFAVTAPLFAQDSSDMQAGMESEQVVLDVKDKPIQQVLNYLSIVAGINIIADPGIDDLVTLPVTKPMPWEEVLNLVCERYDCVAIRTSPVLIKVSKPQRVTFTVENAPIDKVISTISAIAGINIVYSPSEIKGLITMSFTNVPWKDALDTIVKTAGFAIVQESSGVIRIVPPDKLKTQLETRHFALKYITPPSVYKASISSEVLIGKPPMVSDPVASFTFVNTLKNMLTKDDKGKSIGELTYDSSTNTIIVTDTKPVLDAIDNLIRKLDIPPKQVMIDVKVISTGNTELAQMGIQYQGTGGAGGIPVTTSTGGTGTPLLPKLSTLPFGFGRDMSISDNFFMTSYEMNATMRLFREDSNSRIVQAPQIIAINGQEATIHVGDEIRWAQTKASSSQSGTLAFELSEADSSPLQTGFQLFVVPYIARDTNNVIMTVVPKNTALSTKVSSAELGPGFAKFELQSTATGSNTIFLPWTRNTTVVTKLMVESGQTAVIGGLVEETHTNGQEKIPFFGDLPLLGTLFRYEDDSVSKNHLILFITPEIIISPDEMKDSLRKQAERRLFENSGEFKGIEEKMTSDSVKKQLEDRQKGEEGEFEKIEKGETNNK